MFIHSCFFLPSICVPPFFIHSFIHSFIQSFLPFPFFPPCCHSFAYSFSTFRLCSFVCFLKTQHNGNLLDPQIIIYKCLPRGEQSVNIGTSRGTLSTLSRCGLMLWTPRGNLACSEMSQRNNTDDRRKIELKPESAEGPCHPSAKK